MFLPNLSCRYAEEKVKGEWDDFFWVGGFHNMGTPGKRESSKWPIPYPSFWMEVHASRVPEGSSLAYLLKHWRNLDPENLWKKIPIFCCTQAWPQHSLGDQEKWPEGRSISYNTILQVDLFCKKEVKWVEVPYVQLFFYLRNHSEWLEECELDSQTLIVLCRGLSSEPPNLWSNKVQRLP
jgi:hypothetical protein